MSESSCPLSPDVNCSDGATSETASPFRRSRFLQTTRREAMERRFHRVTRSPSSNDDEKKEDDAQKKLLQYALSKTVYQSEGHSTPNSQDSVEVDARHNHKTPKARGGGYSGLQDAGNRVVSSTTPEDSYTSFPTSIHSEEGQARHESQERLNLPQHLVEESQTIFYRVVYRGVVALLTEPHLRSQRSGNYLSFGEIFTSHYESVIDGAPHTALSPRFDDPIQAGKGSTIRAINQSSFDPSTAAQVQRRLKLPSMPFAESPPMPCLTENRAIRVDGVLTGGYAIEAPKQPNSEAKTPRRSNAHIISHDASPFGNSMNDPMDFNSLPGEIEYIFAKNGDRDIVERLSTVPRVERGLFHYKIISSTPIPILTGPSPDAPKTKALALPSTVHDVSLRICVDPDREHIWFLRLRHKRGWIPDRKVIAVKGGETEVVSVVKEVDVGTSSGDDTSISALSSICSSTITAPHANSRRRHRPPRKQRETSIIEKVPPRHIGGKQMNLPPLNSKNGTNDSSFDKLNTTPSSNISILSDDSSFEQMNIQKHGFPSSPDVSFGTARSASSTSRATQCFYLMRVNAPRGLKVLDAPHFQVNNLIHGKSGSGNVSSSNAVSQIDQNSTSQKGHSSIFQTMSGRMSSGPAQSRNPAIFDANTKTRIIPRGALFEASRRVEGNGAFSQGKGLIKLSDNSGWAIVPHQDDLDAQYRNYHGGFANVKEGEATRAYEEVGNAFIDVSGSDASQSDRTDTVWIRVLPRCGLNVSCPPPQAPVNDDDTSPTSSRGSSAVSGSNHGSSFGFPTSNDSDVASSVGSGFLDAMFRTPKKRESDPPHEIAQNRANGNLDKLLISNTIPCGMCVEAEKWVDLTFDQKVKQEYVRLHGGQGWLPLTLDGKIAVSKLRRPEYRFGSIWFRVQSSRGIKVRLGPSRAAPSIKLEDGSHFRFECGEFLRASEVFTIFSDNGDPAECFAKLYRNRHVRLYGGHEEWRPLPSLTAQAEWVQVYNAYELFLEECAEEPRVERHRQGWRYNVVPDGGVSVRRGPSFVSEKTGILLLGGESVVVNERVTPAGDKITWLRLKDGQGWVHDVSDDGEQVMIAHSLRHRVAHRPRKMPTDKNGNEIEYNTIIARLFHNDSPVELGEGNERLSFKPKS